MDLPEDLNEGEIRILRMMETKAGTDYYIAVLKEIDETKNAG